MQLFETVVIRVSRGLDFIAGIILAATALLVVANILGRVLLGQSILGTYEMVGYFTAGAVGLALARCALENSHIAVEFIVEKLPPGMQKAIELIVSLPAFAFLLFLTFNLIAYGYGIAESGEVSSTIRLAYYPFIYLVGIGFFMLAMVALLKMLKLITGGEK